MNKHLKSLLIVIPFSFALAGLTVALCLLSPDFEPTANIIVTTVLLTVWAFFAIPSLPFIFEYAKDYLNKFDFAQGFRIGYLLGCGWGIVIVLFQLFISPITGTVWIVRTVKAYKNDRRKLKNKSPEPTDIFEV